MTLEELRKVIPGFIILSLSFVLYDAISGVLFLMAILVEFYFIGITYITTIEPEFEFKNYFVRNFRWLNIAIYGGKFNNLFLIFVCTFVVLFILPILQYFNFVVVGTLSFITIILAIKTRSSSNYVKKIQRISQLFNLILVMALFVLFLNNFEGGYLSDFILYLLWPILTTFHLCNFIDDHTDVLSKIKPLSYVKKSDNTYSLIIFPIQILILTGLLMPANEFSNSANRMVIVIVYSIIVLVSVYFVISRLTRGSSVIIHNIFKITVSLMYSLFLFNLLFDDVYYRIGLFYYNIFHFNGLRLLIGIHMGFVLLYLTPIVVTTAIQILHIRTRNRLHMPIGDLEYPKPI